MSRCQWIPRSYDSIPPRAPPDSQERDDGIVAEPLLCGYNAISFDVPLLNAEFARCGIPHRLDPGRVLDPIVWIRWFRRHWRERTLAAATKAYGVELSSAHAADADAEATAALTIQLVRDLVIPDDVELALIEQVRGGR